MQPSSRTATVLRYIAAGALALFGLVLLIAGLNEAWFTVLFPDPDVVASYHFGSEAMVGHGGRHYLNPEVYGWTSLATFSVGAAVLVVFALAILRKSWRFALIGVVLFLVLRVGNILIDRADWQRRATLRVGLPGPPESGQLTIRSSGQQGSALLPLNS